MLYNSERDSLAKLAPRLTSNACDPSKLKRQKVKLIRTLMDDIGIQPPEIDNSQLIGDTQFGVQCPPD